MARVIRIVNAFYAALFVVMAIVSAVFLGAGGNGFTGAGDRVSGLGWSALFVLLAVLAFVNLRRAGAEDPRALILLNLAAAVPLALGAIAADGMRFLCGAAALPFALTGLTIMIARARDRA